MNRLFFPGVAAILCLQALFLTAYIGREHTIYYWDHAMYHTIAQSAFAAFQSGLAQGVDHFRASMANDYNDLFTLPSMISFALLGTSRSVFIFTNFAVFFVAYEIACGLIVARVLAWPFSKALLVACLFCSAIPPLWVPLVEGYPDIGAAACLVFAVALAIRRDFRIPTAMGMGALLALAFLIRRHFAYPALALIIVRGGFDVWTLATNTATSGRRQRMFKAFLFYLALGFAALDVLFVVAPGLVTSVLSTDYGSIYASYERSILDVLHFNLNSFGLLLTGVCVIGLGSLARHRVAARSDLALFLTLGIVSVAIWGFGPGQIGHHYVLHVLPLLGIVGLAGLMTTLRRIRRPAFGLAALTLVLAGNSAWALWGAEKGVPPNDLGAPGLLSAPRPPVVRHDLDQLTALAKHIADTTMPTDVIYAVGSSFIFNQDILRAVYTDILYQPGVALRMVFGPEIDSRGFSPLNAFASANAYIVADPPQVHLRPDAQQSVVALAQLFQQASPVLPVTKDESTYALDDGVTVSVWRRDEWKPGDLHQALGRLRQSVPTPHPDWIALSSSRILNTGKDLNGKGIAEGLVFPGPASVLWYDHPLKAGSYALQAELIAVPNCAELKWILEAHAANGRLLTSKTIIPALIPGSVHTSFAVPDQAYVSFVVNNPYRYPCSFRVQQLAVTSDDNQSP